MQIRSSDFKFAMDRLDDFRAVHISDLMEDKVDALKVLLDFIGMKDSAKMDMMHWIQENDGHGQEGGFLLGVAIGIIATKHAISKDLF